MRIADASCEPVLPVWDKYDRDPGLEPRAGDRVVKNTRGGVMVRAVLRTFFSVPAQKRFVVYRTPSGSCFSVAIERWRRWAGGA
jgi:hypothetical protein